MRRPVNILKRFVIFGTGILVPDQKRNGRAQGTPHLTGFRGLQAAEPFNGVGFFSGGSVRVFRRLSQVQRVLDRFHVQENARRHSVQNAAYGCPVGLPKGGQAKDLSPSVSCHAPKVGAFVLS